MDSQLLGFISFGFAALAYGVLAVLLAMRRHADLGGRMFLLAIIVQAVWAAVMALGLTVVQVPGAIGSSAEAHPPLRPLAPNPTPWASMTTIDNDGWRRAR